MPRANGGIGDHLAAAEDLDDEVDEAGLEEGILDRVDAAARGGHGVELRRVDGKEARRHIVGDAGERVVPMRIPHRKR